MPVRPSSPLAVLIEGAEGLLDIFKIGANAMDDRAPDADARSLQHDLEQIGGDFRHVMSAIESGSFSD